MENTTQLFTIGGTDLRMVSCNDVDNTGAKRVWDAAVVLAGMFADPRSQKLVKGRRVVELGAGLGYLSSALALLGASVVSTEMEELLPALRRNTMRAVECAKGDGKVCEPVEVARLDWSTADDDVPALPRLTEAPFDLVVASDVVYQERYIAPFLRAIGLILEASPKAHVYVAIDVRDVDLCNRFEQMLGSELNLKVKPVPRKKLPPPYNGEEWAHASILHGRR